MTPRKAGAASPATKRTAKAARPRARTNDRLCSDCRDELGPNLVAALALVAELRAEGPIGAEREVHVASLLTIAGRLDRGDPASGPARTPALVKAQHDTLELLGLKGGGDDEDPDPAWTDDMPPPSRPPQ